MKQLLMCYPKYFDVLYDINPWMTHQIGKVSSDIAVKQWTSLFDKLNSLCRVNLIEGVPGLPDMVFTANGGIVFNDVAVLSRFSTRERSKEEYFFHAWFQEEGYDVFQPRSSYEGEGDHLIDSNNRHWLGSGFRSTKKAAREIENYFDITIHTLELVDPRWYHLDTCFLPLDNNTIIWYPKAFSHTSQQLIREKFDTLIEVSTEDALKFVCNGVLVKNDLLLPSGSKIIESISELGYNIHEFNLTEFIKAGGAAKCLVLTI